jgi:hypothetical protein
VRRIKPDVAPGPSSPRREFATSAICAPPPLGFVALECWLVGVEVHCIVATMLCSETLLGGGRAASGSCTRPRLGQPAPRSLLAGRRHRGALCAGSRSSGDGTPEAGPHGHTALWDLAAAGRPSGAAPRASVAPAPALGPAAALASPTVLAAGGAALLASVATAKLLLDKPSRPYEPGSVGREYDAWTEEGILEYYWGASQRGRRSAGRAEGSQGNTVLTPPPRVPWFRRRAHSLGVLHQGGAHSRQERCLR